MSNTSTQIDNLPKTGFVRVRQLIPGILPISKSTLWAKVKAGTFPAPIKLGPRTTAWPASMVREWIEAQK